MKSHTDSVRLNQKAHSSNSSILGFHVAFVRFPPALLPSNQFLISFSKMEWFKYDQKKKEEIVLNPGGGTFVFIFQLRSAGENCEVSCDPWVWLGKKGLKIFA